MDGEALREAVEEAKATELDRLDSPRLVLALTGGDPDPGGVLRAAAHSEYAARETFRAWAGTAEDQAVRAAFERVAEQEDEHYRRVLDVLSDADFEPADGGPMHAYLRGREDAIERVAAGMVGRPLASLRTYARIVEYFVDEGDARTADTFRDLRAETAAVVDDGLSLLEDRCDSEDDWERARMVAEYVVQVSCDDFADGLANLGSDPE
ncbi:MAG: ferritin family protein [Salinigranum sp.]